MGFSWKEFGNGFKTGLGKTLQVGGNLVPIPGLSKAGEAITKLHKGGKVPETGNYRLMGGEVVLNKTQLGKIKRAKTAAGVQSILRKVKAQKPKPMGKRRRKRR